MADDTAQRLRALRHLEFEALRHDRGMAPPGDVTDAEEPAASVTQVHGSTQALLQAIEAAEQAMSEVLRAWEEDPARRGAHLLPDAVASAAQGEQTVLATAAAGVEAGLETDVQAGFKSGFKSGFESGLNAGFNAGSEAEGADTLPATPPTIPPATA